MKNGSLADLRGVEFSLKSLVNDVQVVESAPTISLCAAEQDHVNAQLTTYGTRALLPRLFGQDLPVRFELVLRNLHGLVVLGDRGECGGERHLSSIEGLQRTQTACLPFSQLGDRELTRTNAFSQLRIAVDLAYLVRVVISLQRV